MSEDLRPGSLRPERLIPRWDQKNRYMTRVGWRVLWMDGRAVQYFVHEKDAMRFAKDYCNWDSSAPEQCYLPKGARLRENYGGPHPSVGRR